MFQISIVVFREFLEIALLMSVVFAATKYVPNRNFYATLGIIAGIVGSCILAFFTNSIVEAFQGVGQEIFTIILLSVTILLISWTICWMAANPRRLPTAIKSASTKVAMGRGSRYILTSLIATNIFREGFEIVLFSYGVLTVNKLTPLEVFIGFGAGGLLGIITALLIYKGLLNVAGKYVFKVSTFMLVLITASLASEVANLLSAIGVVDILAEPMWDSSFLIPDRSVIGRILAVLAGYTAQPTGMQFLFYIGTILLLTSIIKFYQKKGASR